MRAKFILRCFFLVFIVFHGFCLALDCYIFNVGDANFSMLRSGNKALFVNCGAQYSPDFDKTEVRQKIEGLLDGVTEIKIFVTHNHRDHKNVIKHLFGDKNIEQYGAIAITKDEKKPIKPSIMIASSKEGEYDDDGLHWVFVQNLEKNRTKVIDFLSNSLLDSDVEPFLSNVDLGPDEHDHNILIKVTSAGQRILFTGDASGHLLTRLLTKQERALDTFLDNISLVVLPHHGSNKNCEQMWFFRVKSRHNLICSALPSQWFDKKEYKDAIETDDPYRLLVTGSLGNIGDYYQVNLSAGSLNLFQKVGLKKTIINLTKKDDFFKFSSPIAVENDSSDDHSSTDGDEDFGSSVY